MSPSCLCFAYRHDAGVYLSLHNAARTRGYTRSLDDDGGGGGGVLLFVSSTFALALAPSLPFVLMTFGSLLDPRRSKTSLRPRNPFAVTHLHLLWIPRPVIKFRTFPLASKRLNVCRNTRGPRTSSNRRAANFVSCYVPRYKETERGEKARAFATGMPPPAGGINSRLGRAQKRSTDRGRAARYKGRKLNQGIKIKLGLIKWRGSGGSRRTRN